MPHLREVAQSLVLDCFLAPLGLLGRERGADHPDTASGGVAHHAAPAAADVE
ncbi:Uncharacterised protein [Mycobacterium tuberculosis]|nr:Uncharacterised protein [Mycobacterium tuberculosis]CPB12371.1 Uncharacterised protein [Mycobacterium tuberculosis]